MISLLKSLSLFMTVTLLLRGNPTLGEDIPEDAITNPNVCLSNLECPKTSTCDNEGQYPQFQCVPRKDVGESCITFPFSVESCLPGLYCSFGKCSPTLPIGANCTLNEQCGPAATCRRTDQTCQKMGLKKAPCEFSFDCDIDAGFYCNTAVNRCVPRKAAGSPCTNKEPAECAGYCNKKTKLCMETKKEATFCSNGEQCSRFPYRRSDRDVDDALCNIPKNKVGICVTESRLVKELGAPCSIRKDRCDARRGLSCQWNRNLRKAVCHQKRKETDQTVAYCTPGNDFSICVNDAIPRGCRKPPYDNSDPDGYLERVFYRCVRAYETVPRGAICNRVDYAVCANGTSCRTIPGVSELEFRTRPPRLSTCVVVRGLGESCSGSKFRTQCEYGLKCENDVCVTGNSEIPYTHSDIDDVCSRRPCVPGTVCLADEKVCSLPTRTVQEGNICYESARFYRVRKWLSLHFLCGSLL